VLDKIDLENKTKTRITSKERIDTRVWNAIAIREAIINAIVHNDYTNEVPPKFEIFDDRIEITSAGSLPDLLSQDEFFEGFSIPRNQEIMRIFKDLELVEHLGSGVPRILEAYSQRCFKFTENFLRMTFPNTWDLSEDQDTSIEVPVEAQVEAQVKEQVKEQVGVLINIFHNEMSVLELMTKLNLKGRRNFLHNYLQPSLSQNLIEMTQPNSPNSPTQKYRLTEKGKILQKLLKR